MEHAMPFLVSAFGIILSLMLGMAISRLNSITTHLAKINGRLTEHVENKDLHYAAQARMDEQIKSLLATVQIAHVRIDAIKATG